MALPEPPESWEGEVIDGPDGGQWIARAKAWAMIERLYEMHEHNLDGKIETLDLAANEIDRLHRALEQIAAGHPDGGVWAGGGAEKIARAALSDDASNEKE